jgi:Flp pilus assembly CpaE family ATPase
LAAANHQIPNSCLVFFGSPQLEAETLTSLGTLCGLADGSFKVVFVGPTFSASNVLQAIRIGAIDCLVLNSNLSSELRHLLERLETTPGERTPLGQLFTVIAPVGGAGASALAVNLAAKIASRKQKCALLDLHWRGGDLSTFLNCNPPHNLLSLAGRSDQLDRTMFEKSLVPHESGIHLLASPKPFSDYRQIRSELIPRIVQLSRTSYATVIVDMEDCEHPDQVRTLAASERIIVPIRPDFISLVRTKEFLRYLATAKVNAEHITLVANRTGRRREISLEHMEEALRSRICHHIPEDEAAFNESINLGVPLVTACPSSKAAASITRLADFLLAPVDAVPQSYSSQQGWFDRQHLAVRWNSVGSWLGAKLN